MTTPPTTTDRVDNRIGIETPEAVEFQLDLAGIVPRTGAWILDGSAKMVVIVAAGLMSFLIGELALALLLLSTFGVLWLYNPLFEIFNDGQTPGKAVFGIRVAHRDGTPVGWYGAIVRNLVRVVDLLPFGYMTGVVSMIVGGRFQRLGDVAGDTIVVYERTGHDADRIEQLPEAEPVDVTVKLEPREQEAIVAYGTRCSTLGEERSAELAMILSSMVDGTDRRDSMKRLQGLARRIVQWG